ncbi:MAG: cobyric acid synthase [Alphaproteobacteria bacterium]|nr:cobyric acid synthase [Alphaproteobacteria bacterium]MCB9795994.1 cobyric acid synthase [Alphaproteobacteria bacterium]
MSLARLLCVFGTGSDVGKSWITAGLCRLFRQAGVDVAPFKAQNMSNNAGVTPEGLEMGRAQIVQAYAAGVVPHVDMNPLLLKPNTDLGAQVVALGRVLGDMSAHAYFSGGMEQRRTLVTDALDRLRAQHALIVAEGAGSCAEVNLRDRDLVNMPIAHHGEGRVLIVADIHKGGVFAQIVGTMQCMPPEDRARVAGFIVNRFRGDPRLFEDGVAWLEDRTGLPILGVVPWTRDIRVELEDALAEDTPLDPPPPRDAERLHAAVLCLPHMANFTDFDALERQGVVLHYLTRPRDLSPYALLLLPGTKNTRGDLAWLRAQGWDAPILRYEGHIVGLCGGYQMLGEWISDPHGVEGAPGETPGLGLLPVRTTMAARKTTRQAHGRLGMLPVEGYEIHVGRTEVDAPPLLHLLDEEGQEHPEGAELGRVMGSYLHGLFDAPGVAQALLGPLRPELEWPELPDHAAWREQQLDALAAHLRESLDLQRLGEIAGFALR